MVEAEKCAKMWSRERARLFFWERSGAVCRVSCFHGDGFGAAVLIARTDCFTRSQSAEESGDNNINIAKPLAKDCRKQTTYGEKSKSEIDNTGTYI
ncbi:hypothetical protein BaRGS_00010180 [Batillaria attramentaria]|uniref:Uncharacterized protein n=1 Tax=Batillaria attramentaria TaxID=370345 RepID=A0ABD0LGN1_9CAEN